MWRQAKSVVLCLGVIVVAAAVLGGAQAWATTCSFTKTSSSSTCCSWQTTSSGYTYCALWCTGSEVFTNVMSGLGGNTFGDCSTTGICPETSNQVYGTIDPLTGGYDSTCNNTDLTNLNPNCAIVGIAYCENNGGNSKLKNPQVQGQPFEVTGVLGLDIPVVPADCDKQGKCTTNGKLEADLSAIQCQNKNWTPLTFTASEYKGKACFCPGGYAADGTTCCADTSRNTDGTCVNVWGSGASLGTATCMIALCTADLSTYNPLTNPSIGYNCNSIPFNVCGGLTGILCP